MNKWITLFLFGITSLFIIGNYQNSYAKNLDLPDKTKYDSVIQNNKITKTIGDDVGIETSVKKILNPESSEFIKLINYVIGAIALIWLTVLGGKFALSGGEEEKLSAYKGQFGWIILGLLIVSVAEYAGYKVFSGEGGLTDEGSINKFVEITDKIILFIQYIVGGVALIAGVRSGYALIVNGDDSDTEEKEKEFVKIFLFALGLILFAEAIGTWVNLTNTDGDAINSELIVKEVIGLTNFILMFVSAAALFMIVLSAGYYVISFGNDDLTGRAKKIIISSVVALIIAFSSYTLISFLT